MGRPAARVIPSTSAAEGIDGQAGLGQLGRLQGQVQGGQLEETEGMVGHDHLGRGAGQLLLQLGQLGRQLLLGRLVGRVRPGALGAVRGPGRRPGPAAPVGDSRRIGRSPSGVQRVLIGLPYVLKTEEREAGPSGPHPATVEVRPGRSTAVGRALLSDACPFRVEGPEHKE